MSVKLRLLKIIVQPVFVIDDGASLVEQTPQPITLTPAQIATFPEDFAAGMEQLRQQVEQGDAEH